ncbi:hypothetical protein [Corallococcus silvisoli]|uniref:hypothetical protein n=1 Tax=Corallococcus silvisoli TaxID=2697031 RepID=UPI0013788B6E|nr:hypothetical protein [Corallococcus silvisoli]NBD10280.1 hypothetical protein [Corallococcus silvisoli]
MSRPLRGQVDPDGPPESPSRGARPLPPFIREGLGWILAIQLLLAFIWVGPPRAELFPVLQVALSIRMTPVAHEQARWDAWLPATASTSSSLLDVLHTRVHQARVWLKAAATVRRHAVPLLRAELESWWHEALAAQARLEARCAS